MNTIKLGVIFLVALIFSVTFSVHAQSDKKVQPGKIGLKGSTEMQQAPPSFSQTPQFTGFRQGYRMVTDVLDGFGGESESPNYTIKVNSGGQASPISASASATFVIRSGFVHSSHVKRGDPNANQTIDLGDAIYTLNYLFKGGPNPCPMEAGDANCSGVVDLGDAIFILNYLFKGGPAPVC